MQRRRQLGTTLALMLALCAASAAAAQESAFDRAIAQFAERIAADVQADAIGSIVAGVVVGDRVVWSRAFGWADRDRQIAADARTIYRIGSISKSVTAVAMARLIERSVIRPGDPVIRWLPEFATLSGDSAAVRSITLAQLASHTGGLIREPQLPGAAAGPIEGWESKIVAALPRTSLNTAPGTAYAYSNIGYGILGLTISRAARVPFMTLVTDDVLRPLGMASSYFVVPPDVWPRVATGYANGARGSIDAELPAREHAGRGYKVPNGGIYSTVDDLARFIALMTGALGDHVLSPASRATMLRIHSPGSTTSGYGFGFQIATDSLGNRFVSHGGSVAGYTANILFHTGTRIGVILLRNYNAGRTNLGAASRALVAQLARTIPASR